MTATTSPRKTLRRHWTTRRKQWKAGWIGDLTCPRARNCAHVDALVFDHGILRLLWRNRHEIAPGIWRSNQPDPVKIRALAAEGFRTVINLRGQSNWGSYLLEREVCREVGLRLIDIKLQSWRLPSPAQIEALAAILAGTERPFLMHCKSGADRVGFASAVYKLAVEGRSVAEARRQLSLRYLHIRAGRTGILDALVDAYAEAADRRGIGFLDWVRDGYEPEGITSRYLATSASRFQIDRLLGRE